MTEMEYERTERVRCIICKGIGFDAGGRELVRNKQAAAIIDPGDAKAGKESNAIGGYRCPRCSGAMVKMVDSRQRHIWYEVCSSCSGSFFDAGEFTDLTQHTISDFFKSLSTPERK